MEALISNGIVLVVIAVTTLIIKLAIWYGEVNSDRKQFREAIKEMREAVEEVRGIATDVQVKFDQVMGTRRKTADSVCPLKLNERGRKVSAEFDAAGWVARHLDCVYDDLKDQQEYDVQERCQAYAGKNDRLTGDDLVRAKQVAYDNSLPLWEVQNVLSLELRDAVLARREAEKNPA